MKDLAWRRAVGGYLDVDARIWFFTNYYSISPGMVSRIPIPHELQRENNSLPLGHFEIFESTFSGWTAERTRYRQMAMLSDLASFRAGIPP